MDAVSLLGEVSGAAAGAGSAALGAGVGSGAGVYSASIDRVSTVKSTLASYVFTSDVVDDSTNIEL